MTSELTVVQALARISCELIEIDKLSVAQAMHLCQYINSLPSLPSLPSSSGNDAEEGLTFCTNDLRHARFFKDDKTGKYRISYLTRRFKTGDYSIDQLPRDLYKILMQEMHFLNLKVDNLVPSDLIKEFPIGWIDSIHSILEKLGVRVNLKSLSFETFQRLVSYCHRRTARYGVEMTFSTHMILHGSSYNSGAGVVIEYIDHDFNVHIHPDGHLPSYLTDHLREHYPLALSKSSAQ